MSSVRVSVMLSLVAGSAAMGMDHCSPFVEQPAACKAAGCRVKDEYDCVPACDWWVEQPTECVKAGCMVKDEWNCVEPETETETGKSGRVWVQFPEVPALGGLPPLVTPDQEVPGVPVKKAQQLMKIVEEIGVLHFPRFLEGTHFHPVPHVLKGGGLRFKCPERKEGKGKKDEPCDFFVTVFACGHCSGKVDGGLPELLTVTNGWEPRSCAPAMSVAGADGSAEQYKMKIFRVQVHPGQSAVTPRLPREAHFVAVFSSTEPTEYCPVPVRPVGPFPPMRNCGAKCPFERLG